MITVVIPLYNKEKSINSTIQSVLGQKFSDFELLIVNDGSTDRSIENILCFSDKRIKILNQSNRGVSFARNHGISKAKHNLIALLDADDIWEDNYLDEMVKFINAYPEASMWGCSYGFISSNKKKKFPSLIDKNFQAGYINYFDKARNNTLFTSSSVIFKKDDFQKLGGFDISLIKGEDIDLWIRFGICFKTAFINRCYVFYRLEAENRALNLKFIDPRRSLISNLEKYELVQIPFFKEFMDNWRLANVINYLKGQSNDIGSIKPILKKINLSNKSIFWTIIKLLPSSQHRRFYSFWKNKKRNNKLF